MLMTIRTFDELQKLKTFEERYEYLRLDGTVGETTFGFDRYINQMLYRSSDWLRVRDKVILRDNACDLGIEGYEITGYIIIHHMNPIDLNDIKSRDSKIFDPNFLICTTHRTHEAIHYGDRSLLPQLPIRRRYGDTSPWL